MQIDRRNYSRAWTIAGLLLLTAVGALLRAHDLERQSMWFDEYCAVTMLQDTHEFYRLLPMDHGNREQMPLYFALLYLWDAVFGGGLAAWRKISVVIGALSIPVMFAYGRNMFGRRWGWFAALLLALSPYGIIHSQGIRPYPLELLLGLCAAFAFSRILQTGGLLWWGLNVLCNVLLVWSHLFGCWLLLAQGLTLLAFRPRRWRGTALWTLAHAPGIVLLLYFVLSRSSLAEPSLTSTWYDWLASYFFLDAYRIAMVVYGVRIAGDELVLGAAASALTTAFPIAAGVWTGGVIVSYLAYFGTLVRPPRPVAASPATAEPAAGYRSEQAAFLLLWIVLPTFLTVTLSFLIVPCFQPRYVIYVLPATYLAITGACAHCARHGLRRAGIALALASFVTLTSIELVLPTGPNYVGPIRYIEARWTAGETILLCPDSDRDAFGMNFARPDPPLSGCRRLTGLYDALETALVSTNRAWVVISRPPSIVGAAHGSRFERYCTLRNIRWAKTVFPGRWNMLLYACARPQGFVRLQKDPEIDAFSAALTDSLEDAALRWNLARALEQQQRFCDAAEQYKRILDTVEETSLDPETLSERLFEVGWDDSPTGANIYESLVGEVAVAWVRALAASSQPEAARRTLEQVRAAYPACSVLREMVIPATASRAPTPQIPAAPGRFYAYRLDEHLQEAVTTSPPSGESQPGAVALFPGAGGWTPGKHDSVFEVEEDGITLTAKDRDFLQSPLSITWYGPEVDSITIRMTVSGSDEVLVSWHPTGTLWDWCDEDGNCIIPIRVSQPGTPQTYAVRVDSLPRWQARAIDGLRIILPRGGELTLHEATLNTQQALFPSGAGAREFRIGNSLRSCLYVRTPAKTEYALRLPPDAHFTAAAGIVNEAPAVTFSLDVYTAAGSRTLLSLEVLSDASWLDMEADLSAYANQDVRLVLRTDCVMPGNIALWANPIIVQQRQTIAAQEVPNILFYVVDCLRADHLPVYGYDRMTAPNLTGFARQGMVFNRCLAPATCTRPSMASIFLGVDMLAHGLDCFDSTEISSIPTFVEFLRQAGYNTAAFTENPYTPPDAPKRRAYGMVEDFDELSAGRNGDTRRRVQEFLRQTRDYPFFAYVHTMECHVHIRGAGEMSYESAPPYQGKWTAHPADHLNAFDECILLSDANFKCIWDEIAALGLADETLIVFTADHGEGFGAHPGRIIHSYEPYDELVGVPLIAVWPGRIPAGVRITENVQSLDLAPTFLDAAGLAPFAGFQGMSLWPTLREGASQVAPDRVLFSYEGRDARKTTGISVMQGAFKLFGPLYSPRKRLFHLDEDPGETRSVRKDHGGLVEALEQRVRQHWPEQMTLRERFRPKAEQVVSVDVERDETLRAIGYLE